MNEIRDLIIGIDFGKEYTQMCYYDRQAEEPRSFSMKVGGSQYEIPTCLCRRTEQKDYKIGLEAEYFTREKKGIMIENLYEICQKEEPVLVAGEEIEPWRLVAGFLEGILKFLGIRHIAKNTKCLTITVPELTKIQVQNLKKACEYLEFPGGKYVFLDYNESFYYYVLTQQKETWNRSVGWYTFSGNHVEFKKLVFSGMTRPVMVKMEGGESVELPEKEEDRDDAFTAFIKKTLGRELFSSIQITGEGFSEEWAKRAINVLCFQRRKVYYGNNLFAKGACAAGKEKMEDKRLKGYLYMSSALVMMNVGMDMRVMGAPTYYPLIEAGKNWYECEKQCDFILDHMTELNFITEKMEGSEKKRVIMELPELPERPNRTTRLRMKLQYISANECEIVVRDMGFGDMYPSSGKVWKEIIEW